MSWRQGQMLIEILHIHKTEKPLNKGKIMKTKITLALPDIVVELKYLAKPVNWLSAADPPAIFITSFLLKNRVNYLKHKKTIKQHK